MPRELLVVAADVGTGVGGELSAGFSTTLKLVGRVDATPALLIGTFDVPFIQKTDPPIDGAGADNTTCTRRSLEVTPSLGSTPVSVTGFGAYAEPAVAFRMQVPVKLLVSISCLVMRKESLSPRRLARRRRRDRSWR